MDYKRIIFEKENGLGIIKFNHPKTMNAMGIRMMQELKHAVKQVERDKSVRCLLITGEGRAFCAGANLNDEDRDPNDIRSSGDGLRDSYHPVLCSLKNLEIPLVTAVNGVAAGVGMSFALMGDIVCASQSAYFFQAFARIGLIPDGGSTFLLPRLIGWGRAMQRSMLAERLPAANAHDWGMVNFLFDDEDLQAKACEIGYQLAEGPRSLGLLRKAYWASLSNSYETQLELEASLQDAAGRTQDSKEGVRAFLEKRKPEFTGS